MPLEWPVRPRVRSVQLVELRRAMVPKSRPSSRARFSNSSATSALRPASIRSRRATATGEPGRSSSPVKTTMMSASRRVPAACIALKRRDDHRIAALAVADARAGGAVAVPREALERRIRLEHRVEMADQQQALALPAAAVGGDDMAGAAGLAHVDPAHLEAERLELGPHHLADRGDAREVERAAVLIDRPLEQGDRPLALLLDGLQSSAVRPDPAPPALRPAARETEGQAM